MVKASETFFLVYKGLKMADAPYLDVEEVPFNPELKYLQDLVGGFIEHYIIDKGLNSDYIDMWIDDEGKFKQLKPTWALMYQGGLYDVIFGNCVFSKYNRQGETLGLTADDVKKVLEFLDSRRVVELVGKEGNRSGDYVLMQSVGD